MDEVVEVWLPASQGYSSRQRASPLWPGLCPTYVCGLTPTACSTGATGELQHPESRPAQQSIGRGSDRTRPSPKVPYWVISTIQPGTQARQAILPLPRGAIQYVQVTSMRSRIFVPVGLKWTIRVSRGAEP